MYRKVKSKPWKVADESQEGPYKDCNEDKTKTNETVEKQKLYMHSLPYKPKIMYPQRLAKSKNEGQFKKLIELLKKLHITITFT